MKRITPPMFWTVVACALIVVGGNFLASAQRADDAPAAKSTVAVVNMSELFLQHERFKAMLEAMKIDVQQAEADFGNEAEEIKELAEELKLLGPKSPLYEKLEVEVAQRTSDLRLKMELQKKEFMKREAVIYAKIYNEIAAEIGSYSRANGISIVLRASNLDNFDETSERDVILKAMKRQIVFHDRLDITTEIAGRINRPVEKKET